MIREYRDADIDQILAIWLTASVEAHNFIDVYQKHGFTLLGEKTDEHTGHPELVMQYCS